MPEVYDRVKEVTTVTGLGPANLGGAVTNFRPFSAASSPGRHPCYCIDNGAEWEVGIGTLNSGTPWTMSRDTVISSSNGGAKVNFSAGTKYIFSTASAVSFPMTSPLTETIGDIGSIIAGTEDAWFANGANYARFTAVFTDSYGLTQLLANATAMAKVAASTTAMNGLVNNAGAVTGIVASSTAMAAVEASATARASVQAVRSVFKQFVASSYADTAKWVSGFDWPVLSSGLGIGARASAASEKSIVVLSASGGNFARRSTDGGVTWADVAFPGSTDSWLAIVYCGGERFVATSYSGASAISVDDGKTWASGGATPSSYAFLGYGAGRIVGINGGGTASGFSTDGGASWTAGGALPNSANWRTPAYGNGTFVVVADSGYAAYTNNGGVTWGSASGFSGTGYGCAFAKGKFTAIANASNYAYTTSNGQVWNAVALPTSSNWRGICSDGNLLFVNNVSNNSIALTSADGGATWVSETMAMAQPNTAPCIYKGVPLSMPNAVGGNVIAGL